MLYHRINRKQFEYFQAMSLIQGDVLGACNGLLKNQIDLIEGYSKKGIISEEQVIPFIEMINRYTESYLNYLSLEYDLVLSRKQLYHRMLTMINDSSYTDIVIEWLRLLKDTVDSEIFQYPCICSIWYQHLRKNNECSK
jgi:hypothetical protein